MHILIEIFGGVALMLWGIRMVRTGVMRSFGAELRRALSMTAGKPLRAFAVGFGVTSILQSSTATALILSSFAGRGLIGGAAALAIILGADVGTTMVVQVLSFDLTWLSPLLIGAGVIAFLTSESSHRRALARAAIGLGLILLALQLIGQASVPLRSNETLALILKPLTDEILLAVMLTAVLTWMAHSSVAVVLFVMSLAALQVLNMQLALAMVLGANLGGAFIPVVATYAEKPAGRRVAIGNLMMRGLGVLVCVAVLPWVQPYLAMLDDQPARMIANFHTVFNIALALALLPFVGFVHKLTERMIPALPAQDVPGTPRYLDPSSLDTPSVALACAAREALAMGDTVRDMLARSLDVFQKSDTALVRDIELMDDTVDRLHEAIKLYLTRLSKEEMDKAESERNVEVLSFTTNLEHIGDIIDKNLMDLAAKKIKKRASFSQQGLEELRIFHARILENFDLAMNVFMAPDVDMARMLIHQKVGVRDLERNFAESHYARIADGRADSIETSSLHLDVLRDLKRINGHLTSVAYPILDRAGELTQSRLKDEAAEALDRDARLNPCAPGEAPLP
ncbi:Na/Pi cotransporter family protein [Thalassospiraceae bacterium LMO-JJ14]|nr:Na/Pi cotransporter family protein [Thalassospiraceae bacterium LMO-JJ14]